jgi:hypothetical protein
MAAEISAVVGVQITDQTIRVARLEFRDSPRLTDAAELRLPVGVVVNGRVQDEQTIVQLLQRVWQQMTFHWEPVAVALGSPDGILLQLDLEEESNETMSLLAEVGPAALTEQVVTQLVPSHHSIPLVAVALRSSVDRMTSLLDRAGFTVASIDTTPSALARTQPDFWQSTQDLALRYCDTSGIWSVRVGSTVHGTMRNADGGDGPPSFDAVGLGADHSFVAVSDLAGVEISDRLSARFTPAQLAVALGAALGSAPDPLVPVDLRQALPLDRGRQNLAPAEPGETWVVELLVPAGESAPSRRRWRR